MKPSCAELSACDLSIDSDVPFRVHVLRITELVAAVGILTLIFVQIYGRRLIMSILGLVSLLGLWQIPPHWIVIRGRGQ
jgi:hypothetical protein